MIHDFQAFPLKKTNIAFSNIQTWIYSTSSERKQTNKMLFAY